MKFLDSLRFRAAAIFRRERVNAEIDEELRSHIAIHADELERSGLARAEAERRARIKFGGQVRFKEECHEALGGHFIETLLRDVRFGLRMLWKNPGFTAVAVLTLALGIGANTAIFGMVNGFLLRPLPVPHPEQIAALAIQEYDLPLGSPGFSYPEFADFRNESRSVADVFANVLGFAGLNANDRTDQIAVSYVASNYFSALGVRPFLGNFDALRSEEAPGAETTIILGYSYWRKKFGGSPGVIGKSVRLDGQLATIVGIVPQKFHGMYSIAEMDGYLPLGALAVEERSTRTWTDRNDRRLLVFARLRDSVSLAQAQSVLDVVSQRLARQYPASDKGISVRALPERLARPQPYANIAFHVIGGLFLGLAGLVLLLACLNVENVLLARATARQREIGIRAALGASRGRLIRLTLTESLLVALLGGAAGLELGRWTSGLAGSIHLANVPLRLDSAFDWRVFLYVLAATILCGILIGLLPALRASRTQLTAVLHQGGWPGTSAGHRHARDFLVISQVAGSLMLLVVAGLFVRGLERAQSSNLGFEPEHVLNILLDPNQIGYSAQRTDEFYLEIENRIRALPGVESVTEAANIPMGYFLARQPVYAEGHPVPVGQQPEPIYLNSVDPAYFATMRIPLLRGRDFSESDDAHASRVAIVNQNMAARFWPNQDPIGKRFSTKGADGPFMEVVGIAGNGKYQTITENPRPFFYVPLAQSYVSKRFVQIRSSVPPAALGLSARDEILGLDSAMPVLDIETMKESLGGALGFFIFRAGASLAAAMGLIGLTLAVVGVYGVVSFAASQRTREIGIRIALGASKAAVLQLVVRQGFVLIGAGVFAGLGGAWAVTRAMGRLFAGVSPTDPAAFGGATILLVAVALAACWIPTRRAMRVDPMVALRHE